MTVAVNRRIELDLSLDEVRALVATAEGWREWLVDDVGFVVAPGASGWVVADGERRDVVVRRLDEQGIVFEWSDHEGTPSSVSISVDHTGDVPAVEITETSASASAAIEWDVRIAVLWIRANLGRPVAAAR